ncbi:NADH-quinone oxidoreductase subunit L [Eggerthellaceae bacterium zg-1084]|uniref:NADH-quinone oxidoreductase subunit 5 family protein n=1 Tax=Berryella wangjianweii TaxID=2734634 RepID=UPI001557FE1F|nr:proton-conducting transporter membrane subunit [Berryella wangjianweii]NPD31420.1 NADH-quinone oxidoreductase subunit L [Berryella wangjianweii]NPD32273.1 NADH-quinone oxidoreductase subunit L [Eggerthellaceae bacterium zg-997]
MTYIGLLVAVPALLALALLVARSDGARRILVWGGAVLVALLSVGFAIAHLGTPWVLVAFSSPAVDYGALGIGLLVSATVLFYAVRHRNVVAGVLAAVQVAATLVLDLMLAHRTPAPQGLAVDSLSVVMVLVIGVIGAGICVYALGYMDDFQRHAPEGDDRRHQFFALMFVFLSAMFAIVLTNNMAWMLTAWEVTTLCSFLLIGYTRTPEAIGNSFRQINMNLLGGIAFTLAVCHIALNFNTMAFSDFLVKGVANPSTAALPAAALAFAGMTKAAQMPFHTWLLGAMVAPTPTSALLHSSTMVKAGVFLLIKLAPLFLVIPTASFMAVGVGGLTFLFCSFMAISQSNAKRVLAYSTIANLGLIVACAGVGTPEAVWAAVLLLIFHAAAKSLLFLCVGTAEHHIHSRDIEDMDLLFERMPQLARLMMIGIMCMFVAPFGMLIAKWATLVSFADMHQFALVMMLAFGSAATFLFWAKWLGKIAGVAALQDNLEETVHGSEWAGMIVMTFAALCSTILLPVVSFALIEPYIVGVYGRLGQDVSTDNLWIAALLASFSLIVVLAGLRRSKQRPGEVYLSGVAIDGQARTFRNALAGESTASARNLYLTEYFGEARLRPWGEALCGGVMAVSLTACAAAPFLLSFCLMGVN